MFRASLVAPALQETWVQSMGQEDPLEKGIATHSRKLGLFKYWGKYCMFVEYKMRLQEVGAQNPLGKGMLDPLGFSGPLCVSCHPLEKLQISRIPSKGMRSYIWVLSPPWLWLSYLC